MTYSADSIGAAEDIIAIFGGVFLIVSVVITLLLVVSFWKIFVKCGKPGWAILIPIYGNIVMFQAVDKPGWYILLPLIPFVGSIIACVVFALALAKKFDKSTGYAIGIMFLPIIFIPMLAFGRNYPKDADSSVSADATSTTEPVMGENTVNETPAFDNQEAVANEAPTFDNQGPASYEAPTFDNQGPAVNEAPVFDNQEPVSNEAPVFDNQEPVSNEAPVFDNQGPASNEAPTFDSQEPVMNDINQTTDSSNDQI